VRRSWTLRLGYVSMFCLVASLAGAQANHYLITNDDVSGENLINSATFFTIGAGGKLTDLTAVQTSGSGIGGGFFGASRVRMLHTATQDCAYISNALTGNVAGIDITTQTLAGAFNGSSGDSGASNGIGLAVNNKYLYAGFGDSNTIGTFKVLAGCSLQFVTDVSASGLQGGAIDGMAIHGNILVVTFGDGSIESFNVAKGAPVSNGDQQNSTGSRVGNTYPSDIDITQDGHYAIFGDVATTTVIEVAYISSGKLTPTVVYHPGRGISSANIRLSPDETLLYISNNQGDSVSAAFFNATTGVVSAGCVSGKIRGYVTDWSYLGELALEGTTGTGGIIYAAEFGAPSSIAIIKVTSAGGVCTLAETAQSPAADNDSSGLLSIGVYPPRKF
jgi:hypothetical protein